MGKGGRRRQQEVEAMRRGLGRHGVAVLAALLLAALTVAGDDEAAAAQARAQQDALDRRIDRLLRLTQGAELVVEDTLRNIDLSPLPAEDKALYRAIATPESLRQALVPIYRRLLTPAEIEAWIRFYEEGEGRGIAAKQPTLFRASKEVFLEWGGQIAIRAQNEKARRAAAPPQP